MKKKLIALLLAAVLLLLSAACAVTSASSIDLMKGVTANEVEGDMELAGDGADAATDFAVRLFQACMSEDRNSLISPVSVLYALAMTANGAEGEARAEMESVLGMPVEELNEYLYAWSRQGERGALTMANAIWFRDSAGFEVNREFLQTNADYYGAGIYKAPFDKSTCLDINRWVSEHTDGMIEDIIDDISPETVMYLVNALAFDAQWEDPYKAQQVREGIFTTEDGAQQQTQFMYSTVYEYLEDDLAVGFTKEYAGGRYLFVAMLPNEGISVAQYVRSLTGAHLQALLARPQWVDVHTSLPRFEAQFCADLSDALISMGMEIPFREGLDALGTSAAGSMAMGSVLHKTFITVDEKGTKAGAATAVAVNPTSAAPLNYKEVYLDRPFLYLIVDSANYAPIFIGSFMGT